MARTEGNGIIEIDIDDDDYGMCVTISGGISERKAAYDGGTPSGITVDEDTVVWLTGRLAMICAEIANRKASGQPGKSKKYFLED